MDLSLNSVRETFTEVVTTDGVGPTATYFDHYQTKEQRGGDISEIYHENSKYRPELMWEEQASTETFEQDPLLYAQAKIAPDYSFEELHSLPEPTELNPPLCEVLTNRRSIRRYSGEQISEQELSDLLYWAIGSNRNLTLSSGQSRQYRMYPSGGALYPVETYTCVLNCDDIDSGVYFYVPEFHGFRELKTDLTDLTGALEDSFTGSNEVFDLRDAAVLFTLMGIFWRSKAKYGPRGYRAVLQESGHMAQNLQLVAVALGLGSVPIAGFYDDQLNDVLGTDGLEESVVYTLPVGVQAEKKT